MKGRQYKGHRENSENHKDMLLKSAFHKKGTSKKWMNFDTYMTGTIISDGNSKS